MIFIFQDIGKFALQSQHFSPNLKYEYLAEMLNNLTRLKFELKRIMFIIYF